MERITITLYSLGFKIEIPIPRAEAAISSFADSLHAPKLGRERGRVVQEKGDGYYIHSKQDHFFIFHKKFLYQVKEFIHIALRDGMVEYEIVEHEHKHTAPYPCTFDNYGFDMRVDDPESRFFYQNEVVDTASTPGRLQTIFAIQTGRGKTKSAQKTMVNKKCRTAIIVRPAYVDKWEADTCTDPTGLRVKKRHVWIANGVQGIVDLLSSGRTGFLDKKKISVVIIPTVSLMRFLREYFEAPHHYADIDLGEFYNYIGVGQVIYDEVHEHFLTVYLTGIALNPPALLEMSATLQPSAAKAFIIERYLERFPLNARLSVPYIPVVDVIGIYYRIANQKFMNKINRMKLYNHNMFEQGIYREGMRDEYFEMVYHFLKLGYLNKHEKGQRALCFFSMVETCKDFKTFLDYKLMQEGRKLTVAKFNHGDSYKEFMKADIGVSTPAKAGTAVDIPGLVLALVTNPIDDRQLNEQITGRPRPLTKWPITPKVCFFHALESSKHNRYLKSRQTSLKDIVLSFKVAHSQFQLGTNNGPKYTPKTKSSRPFPTPSSKSVSRRGSCFKAPRNRRNRRVR